jgi:hypothetical protein
MRGSSAEESSTALARKWWAERRSDLSHTSSSGRLSGGERARRGSSLSWALSAASWAERSLRNRRVSGRLSRAALIESAVGTCSSVGSLEISRATVTRKRRSERRSLTSGLSRLRISRRRFTQSFFFLSPRAMADSESLSFFRRSSITSSSSLSVVFRVGLFRRSRSIFASGLLRLLTITQASLSPSSLRAK